MLAMKKRGIRFFSKIRFDNVIVKRFHGKARFLPFVQSRKESNDNILLIAHGAEHSILTTTTDLNRPYRVYISLDEANAFQNDFVFAVSCLTALEFGGRCVEEGAISYLGYQVQIGQLFNCYTTSITNMPKRISNAVDLIMKRIFVQSLSKAFQEFLSNPIAVNTLRERFSYLLEREVVELSALTIDQIYEKYGVRILEHHYRKYIVSILLKTLTELKETTLRLVCIGDENYISPTFVKYYYSAGVSKEQLLSEIDNNLYFSKMNIKHQEKIKELILKGEERC